MTELKTLKVQTGIGPSRLLAGRKDIPHGLNSSTIGGWLSGHTKSARKAHIEYALKSWREITPRVEITPEIIHTIFHNSLKVGRTYRALLSAMPEIPEGLSAEMIARWVSGGTLTARKDHLDAVLDILSSLPPKDPEKLHYYEGRTRHTERRIFKKQDGLALEAERERTAISASEMLKYFYRGCVPEGLSASMISAWINSKPRTIPSDLYDWTLKAWKALPDKEE